MHVIYSPDFSVIDLQEWDRSVGRTRSGQHYPLRASRTAGAICPALPHCIRANQGISRSQGPSGKGPRRLLDIHKSDCLGRQRAYPLGTVTQYSAAYLQLRCRKVFSYPHPRTLQSWGECLALDTVDCPCRTRKLDKSRIRRMQHPIRTCAEQQLRRLQRDLCSNS